MGMGGASWGDLGAARRTMHGQRSPKALPFAAGPVVAAAVVGAVPRNCMSHRPHQIQEAPHLPPLLTSSPPVALPEIQLLARRSHSLPPRRS